MGKMRSVPVLALCAIYLFLAAGVALLSTSVYRSVDESSNRHSEQRVALSYVFSQLRAGDTDGNIETLSFGDGDAICIGDGEYETLLYCYDGYLMELYMERQLGLSPASGTPITAAQGLIVELGETGVLHITVQGESSEVAASYRIQTWKGDRP